MTINPTIASPATVTSLPTASEKRPSLREAFDTFVGETFYGQMLSAMRQSVGKPAYFHGGRAEEIFQGQLDQILAQQFTKSDGHNLSGAMYELFAQARQS